MAKRILNKLRGKMHDVRFTLMHSACRSLEQAEILPRDRF